MLWIDVLVGVVRLHAYRNESVAGEVAMIRDPDT
jgi:hypothetical protein